LENIDFDLSTIFAGVDFILILLGYGFFGKKFHKSDKNQKAIKNSVEALLRHAIIQTYNQHVDKGYIPIHERQNVESLFTEYKILGGNGTINNLVEKLRELPTHEPKEKD